MVPRSLRGKLVALVVAAVFPALVIIFYSGFERQNRELEQAKSRVLHIVHGLGAVQERLAASVEQLLIALAKTPMVRERDLQACTGLFRGLAEGNPFYHNVVLADSDGTMLAASLPFSGVSIADRSHFQAAGQNLRFTAGEYVEAKIDPRPIFVFTLPLVDEHGDFDGVLAAAMDLQGFEPLFSREHLPPGAFAGLVDRAGRRLFRIPADNPETFPLGVPIRAEIWDFVSGTTEEVAFIERISNEVTQILACHPLWLPGDERPYMYMLVGIPKAQVLAEAKALLVRDAGLLILASVLALITAWVMGTRTVVGRFRRLEKTAEALSRGRLDARTGLDYRDGELGRLAEAFDRMADQLVENLAEERRIKKELMIERDRAEMSNRSKSEFLANMSHEIRTPLNGIMGMMQLLQMSALDGQQKEFVGLAADSVRRLNRLLSDILDLSRVEAGKLDIHRAPFEIRTLEDSVLGLFTITARDKGLELTCVTDPTLPRRLVGDEARIRQVLFNLVGNALKFTDTGRISVEITALPERPSGEIRVLFSVSDTGTGIPEDKIRDIFQPFVQVDGSMTRGHQGAGLGLAIVRRLVALMGGKLSLESAPNEGTVVHFVLTFGVVGEEAEEKRHDDIRKREGKGAGLAILLVEDDKINQLSVTGLLEKLGHRPEPVFDGEEALAALERRRFDLVLMDIQLPDMDGIETTRRIRSHDGSVYDPKIPVVALTAHAMAGDRERFLDAGLDDYLAKPVGIEDLKAVLGRFGPTEGEGS